MYEMKVSLVGSNSVRQRFERMPVEIHDALRDKLETVRGRLEAAVVAATPYGTGRGPLGHLRDLIQSGLEDRQGRIRAWVSYAGNADFKKISALEYGNDKVFDIKAATRQRSVVFGRMVTPFQLSVSAYSRLNNIVAMRFLRDSFDQFGKPALEDMKAAAVTAAGKA
ncbi:MAG: hypothetical protein V4564_07820 [Pseudomonadota bacterium]